MAFDLASPSNHSLHFAFAAAPNKKCIALFFIQLSIRALQDKTSTMCVFYLITNP